MCCSCHMTRDSQTSVQFNTHHTTHSHIITLRSLSLTHRSSCSHHFQHQHVLSAGQQTLVCNLQQNPAARPVVSHYLPTLLRNGTMWILNLRNVETHKKAKTNENMDAGTIATKAIRSGQDFEERYMLGKEPRLADSVTND